VLTSPDLAARIAQLAKLYGHFDWTQLDRFSYIEHKGDLIVTTNNISVNNSSNVVIQSTLTNAQLVAGSLPSANDSERQRLRELLEQLQRTLPTTPFDKSEQAEAVAQQAETLVEEAAKPKPNRTTLQVLGQGLKATADFIKDAVPATLGIVTEIVALISRIHGLPQ
jgi:hypothetical protein